MIIDPNDLAGLMIAEYDWKDVIDAFGISFEDLIQ